VNHPNAKGLNGISRVLVSNLIIYEMALQDLTVNVSSRDTVAEGMSAEQVVRIAIIIKQMEDYSKKAYNRQHLGYQR